MQRITQDFKIGFRNIRTKPLFGAMIIGMLALGVGGNAVVFSIFDGLFLRPLPFPESERLIDLDETAPKWNLKYVGISSADYYQWRRSNSTFGSMAFYRVTSYNLVEGKAAHRARAAQVTYDMMAVLGLKPAMGHNFRTEEDRPGGHSVALLSYSMWRQMFGADRNILGRVVKLDEEAYTIIGILPATAAFPDRTELWTNLRADPNIPSGYYLSGIGRLKAGVSIQQARADLLRVHKAMMSRGSKINEFTSPILTPLRDRYLGDFRIVSGVLMGGVAVVLLIACVNIAALMMARGSSRAREIAIRSAIGASRARIVAQLLTENLLLAIIGSGLGVGLGTAWLRGVTKFIPQTLPEWVNFSLDWRFAIFCIGITAAATLLFGLLPSLQASRTDVRTPLQDGGTRTTFSPTRHTVLGALVACEVGLAVVLSLSSGLLLGAFHKIMQVNPGFQPENVLTFQVSLPEATYDSPEKKVSYFDNLLRKLRVLPGVMAAGVTSAPPLGAHWGGQFEAEGSRAAQAQRETPETLRVAVTPGYFDALRMKLLTGRIFDERDSRPMAKPVVLVNETLAKHFWGHENPVGKRIRELGRKDWYEVVGLLQDEKHDGLDQKTMPGLFHPYAPTIRTVDRNDARALRDMSVVVRTSINPTSVVNSARQVLQQLDADVPMFEIHTMTEKLDQSLWARRVYSWLFGVFAVIAVTLAAAGVYGVISYAVGQRTHEIGIRAAIGAQPRQLLTEVLTEGMGLVLLGIAAGVAGSLWCTSLLRTLLFDVNSHDPGVYLSVVLGALTIGLLANFVPAHRAASVDPLRALRLD